MFKLNQSTRVVSLALAMSSMTFPAIAADSYQSWDTWIAAPKLSTQSLLSGVITPVAALPKNVSATYTGAVAGAELTGWSVSLVTGRANLTANFGDGAGTLTGSFDNLKRTNGANFGGSQTAVSAGINASWSGANDIRGTLAGSMTIGGAPVALNGSLRAAFFGPTGGNLAGGWTLAGGRTRAVGIFAAKGP